MFENIKLNKKELDVLKKYESQQYSKLLIKKIFGTYTYKRMSDKYKERFYQTLNSILDMELDQYTLDDTIELLEQFFQDDSISLSNNFYNYLDILLDYLLFPLMDSELFSLSRENDNKDLLKYLNIEAKLYHLDDDFIFYFEELENIILSEELQELNLVDVVINGIINTNLTRVELVIDINNLLDREDLYWIILKLFQAPTNEHYDIVSNLLNDEEVINSSHLLEMIDMIYATPYEKLDDLEFSITHKLIYKDMSFSEACKNYHGEAMKILDETNNIKSYSRVRVPVYIRR